MIKYRRPYLKARASKGSGPSPTLELPMVRGNGQGCASGPNSTSAYPPLLMDTKISFFRRVAGLSLRDRVRSFVIQEELRVEPLLLHLSKNQIKQLWRGKSGHPCLDCRPYDLTLGKRNRMDRWMDGFTCGKIRTSVLFFFKRNPIPHQKCQWLPHLRQAYIPWRGHQSTEHTQAHTHMPAGNVQSPGPVLDRESSSTCKLRTEALHWYQKQGLGFRESKVALQRNQFTFLAWIF